MNTPSGDVKVGPPSFRVVDFGSVRELFPIGTNVNPSDGLTVLIDGDLVAGEAQTVITFHNVPPIITDFVRIVNGLVLLESHILSSFQVKAIFAFLTASGALHGIFRNLRYIRFRLLVFELNPTHGEVEGIIRNKISPSAEHDMQVLGNFVPIRHIFVHQLVLFGVAKNLRPGALSGHSAHSSEIIVIYNVTCAVKSGIAVVAKNIRHHVEEQLGILLISQEIVLETFLDTGEEPTPMETVATPSILRKFRTRSIRPTGHDGRQIYCGDGGTEFGNSSGDMNKVRHN